MYFYLIKTSSQVLLLDAWVHCLILLMLLRWKRLVIDWRPSCRTSKERSSTPSRRRRNLVLWCKNSQLWWKNRRSKFQNLFDKKKKPWLPWRYSTDEVLRKNVLFLKMEITVFSQQTCLRHLWDKVSGFCCFSFAHRWPLSLILCVPLPETTALPGSRSGAGPAPRPAAGVAQKRKGTTFVTAYSSGICDGWPEGREENLGPGASPTRWETGWGRVNQYQRHHIVYSVQ